MNDLPFSTTPDGCKLYLNLTPEVQRTWERDIPGYVKKSDRNWRRIASKVPDASSRARPDQTGVAPKRRPPHSRDASRTPTLGD